jgi:hypothetical protein
MGTEKGDFLKWYDIPPSDYFAKEYYADDDNLIVYKEEAVKVIIPKETPTTTATATPTPTTPPPTTTTPTPKPKPTRTKPTPQHTIHPIPTTTEETPGFTALVSGIGIITTYLLRKRCR